MRHIDRRSLPVPRFFASSELLSIRQNVLDVFTSDSAKRSQIVVERSGGMLEEMLRSEMVEVFRSTCAYCETRDFAGAPYRFRPQTEAEPVQERSTSHLYYAWLATSWDNWLWVCPGCRPDNEAHFPVLGQRAKLPLLENLVEFSESSPNVEDKIVDLYARSRTHFKLVVLPSWNDLEGVDSRVAEKNLLIDPSVDKDLLRHLAVARDSHMVGLTPRGTATIEHFKLNRPNLLVSRREVLGRLDSFLSNIETLQTDTFSEDGPFFGCIQLRLQFLVGHISNALRRRVGLQWPDVIRSFNTLRSHPRWHALFDQAATIDPRKHLVRMPTRTRTRSRSVAVSLSPRITQFEIENFKSLERLSFQVPEHARQGTSREETGAAGALLILGENATGKSSILEAVVLCLVESRMRETLEPEPDRLILDPCFMDPSLVSGPDTARLAATFSDGSKRELIIADGQFRTDQGRTGQPVFAYGAFRQYLKKSPKRLPVAHRVSTLFKTDRLLPNPTPWLLSLDPDRFNMVARSLRAIFAVEGDFDIIERDGEVCYVINHYLDHRGEKRRERTPLDIVSSGFRAILAMACDIMRGLMEGRQARHFQSLINARAIVLIDEIEAHLHPRWKLAIMASLREALPNVTFIVTSHDPLCLRGMASGEVMVMNRVRGEKVPGSAWPVFIETLSTLPNIEELTIEQLLTADFFQLNSTSSRETDREYARIADMLRRQKEAGAGTAPDLNEKEKEAVRSFTQEINHALPVGDTEVQRLVQDAVAIYLKERATKTQEGLTKLRDKTRDRILEALRSI